MSTLVKTARQAVRPRWFSENPDKAWAEKFFLIYTPVWILMMAVVMVLRISPRLGDAGMLLLALVVALPLLIVPLLLHRRRNSALPWHQTYWFKANVYIFLFSLLGNYFGSEYFFDVLGMVYRYPQLRLTFDSVLVGSGQQSVPVIMYVLTLAYFMTYHTTAVVVVRRIKTSAAGFGRWLFPLALALAGFFWAWAETFVMANPLMADMFYYQDLPRMLAYGSIVYTCFFITSFPIFYFLDEKPGARWSLLQTAGGALAASMLTFFLLDMITRFVGHL